MKKISNFILAFLILSALSPFFVHAARPAPCGTGLNVAKDIAEAYKSSWAPECIVSVSLSATCSGSACPPRITVQRPVACTNAQNSPQVFVQTSACINNAGGRCAPSLPTNVESQGTANSLTAYFCDDPYADNSGVTGLSVRWVKGTPTPTPSATPAPSIEIKVPTIEAEYHTTTPSLIISGTDFSYIGIQYVNLWTDPAQATAVPVQVGYDPSDPVFKQHGVWGARVPLSVGKNEIYVQGVSYRDQSKTLIDHLTVYRSDVPSTCLGKYPSTDESLSPSGGSCRVDTKVKVKCTSVGCYPDILTVKKPCDTNFGLSSWYLSGVRKMLLAAGMDKMNFSGIPYVMATDKGCLITNPDGSCAKWSDASNIKYNYDYPSTTNDFREVGVSFCDGNFADNSPTVGVRVIWPELKLSSPRSNENYYSGDSISLNWTSSPAGSADKVLVLMGGGEDPVTRQQIFENYSLDNNGRAVLTVPWVKAKTPMMIGVTAHWDFTMGDPKMKFLLPGSRLDTKMAIIDVYPREFFVNYPQNETLQAGIPFTVKWSVKPHHYPNEKLKLSFACWLPSDRLQQKYTESFVDIMDDGQETVTLKPEMPDREDLECQTTIGNEHTEFTSSKIFTIKTLPVKIDPKTQATFSSWSVDGHFSNSKTDIVGDMAIGKRVSLIVAMRNEGKDIWRWPKIQLLSQNPAKNNEWGISWVDMKERVVYPGGLATFEFQVVAPNKPGITNMQWQLADWDGNFFGEKTPNIKVNLIKEELNASFEGWSVGGGPLVKSFADIIADVVENTKVNLSVKMTNTGNVEWTKKDNFGLGRPETHYDLVSLPANIVSPGASAIFNFDFVVPTLSSSNPFVFQRQMHQFGRPFGQTTPKIKINIKKAGSGQGSTIITPTPVPTTVYRLPTRTPVPTTTYVPIVTPRPTVTVTPKPVITPIITPKPILTPAPTPKPTIWLNQPKVGDTWHQGDNYIVWGHTNLTGTETVTVNATFTLDGKKVSGDIGTNSAKAGYLKYNLTNTAITGPVEIKACVLGVCSQVVTVTISQSQSLKQQSLSQVANILQMIEGMLKSF